MKRALLWKLSSLSLRPSVKIRSSAVDLPLVGEVHLRQVPLDHGVAGRDLGRYLSVILPILLILS
jgi:hypothetical protein